MTLLIRLVPFAAAALVAAGILFRPAPAPTAPPTGWSTAPPTDWATVPSAGSSALPMAGLRAKSTVVPSAVVYVAGAVRRPGVYAVPTGARVGDALARAGGGRPDADLVAVNLAARLRDGEEIAVPVLGAPPPPRATAASGGTSRRHKRSARSNGARSSAARDAAVGAAAVDADAIDTDADAVASGAVGGKTRRSPRHGGRRATRAEPPPDSIDLNSADEKTLEALPGVGPALAARIVLFREANGPFGSVDELLDVSGITERRLDAISPYLDVR